MAEGSHKICKGSSSSDALHSGEMLNNCPSYEYWHCSWWRSEHCRSCWPYWGVWLCPEQIYLRPWCGWAGAPTWSVCQQEQSTVRVGCVALCAQMRDALPHVRCSLQSHPGKALHQTGRWQSCAPLLSSWSTRTIWWVEVDSPRGSPLPRACSGRYRKAWQLFA